MLKQSLRHIYIETICKVVVQYPSIKMGTVDSDTKLKIRGLGRMTEIIIAGGGSQD